MRQLKYIYYMLLLALVLVACDADNNWFYHPVDFKGEIEESKMVVTSMLYTDELPRVTVNQSYFFLNPMRRDTILEPWENWDGDPQYYQYMIDRRGYLDDALVELQVNGGEWQKLVMVRDTEPGGNYYAQPMCYYAGRWPMQEGDSVQIRVSHPDFKDVATVSQVVPYRLEAGVTSVDTLPQNSSGLVDSAPDFLVMNLHIAGYTGAADQVLRITCRSYITDTWLYTYDGNTERNENTYSPQSVYSQDVRFAQFSHINTGLSMGYYGGSSVGLVCDLNGMENGCDISLLTTYANYQNQQYEWNENERSENVTRADSIVLDVEVLTRDAYLNLSSLMNANLIPNEVTDYWDNSSSSEFDIIDIIQDIFDEMGQMEGLQVFDNIEGGLGHVGAASRQHIVLIPGVDFPLY